MNEKYTAFVTSFIISLFVLSLLIVSNPYYLQSLEGYVFLVVIIGFISFVNQQDYFQWNIIFLSIIGFVLAAIAIMIILSMQIDCFKDCLKNLSLASLSDVVLFAVLSVIFKKNFV